MRTLLSHLLVPHHTNNFRARLLHPAGLSVMIGLFLVLQSSLSLWRAMPAMPGGFVLGYASSITSAQTIEMTNMARAREGLPGLAVSSVLSEAAAAKARHMFAQDYWAHIAPDGTTPWTFIRGAGYDYAVAGENLARDFDDTDSMVQAWMNSPTHKENIVNTSYSEIGVAVVDGLLDGVETTLVVQMFGKPAGAAVANAGAVPEADTAGAIDGEEVRLSPAPEVASAPEEVELELDAPTTAEAGGRELAQLPANDTLGLTLSAPSDRDYSGLMISPLTITKVVATSMLILVTGLLLYDAMVIHQRKLHRTIGQNWAHLTLFAFVLLVILSVTQGQVL